MQVAERRGHLGRGRRCGVRRRRAEDQAKRGASAVDEHVDCELSVLGDLRRQRAAWSAVDLAGDGGGEVTDPATRHGKPVRMLAAAASQARRPLVQRVDPVVIAVRLTPVVYFGGYSGDKEA